MASSNIVDKDFSSVSYESLEPHSQLDVSDYGRLIPKGRLAENKVLDTTTTLKDSTLLTIADTLLDHIPSPSTFSFLVSFEHFHVISASKAGYNKIYNFRRSKSFFFEVVDEIHGTNEIHLKIYTNDYHMSQTPIRFHFGIYTPCNNSFIQNTFINQRVTCSSPAPCVLSHYRRACSVHHHKITFYSQSELINPDEIRINLDSKDVHARAIYNRWNKQKKKKIISNRLGISYNTRITVNHIDNILKKGRTNIYNKAYDNLTFCPSNKVNVKKQQTARFERQRRRILHNSALTEDASIEDKLIACKRKGFLFLPSKQITKPVMHLRYKKKYQIPLQRYYNFKIPSLQASQDAEIRQEVHIVKYFNSTKHNLSFDPSEKSNEASSSHDLEVISNPIRTISPTLDVNASISTSSKKVQSTIHHELVILPIPEELLPYVPSEPIYKNGKTFAYLTKQEQRTLKPLIVGSKYWIKAVKSIKALAEEKNALEAHIDELKIKWEVQDKEFVTLYEGLFCNLSNHQNTCHDYFAYLSTTPGSSISYMPTSKMSKTYIKKVHYNPRFNQNHLSALEANFDYSDLQLALAKRDRELYYLDFYSKLPQRERKRTVDNYTNLDSFYGLHISKRSRFNNDK
ncbi:hypothetical protein RhiirA4_425276 [Rhizophagus irregularis]|uniref:DUF8211 domain-containing protein n=1 Tax=Rhizophagus irregularis TaxID=588596 RepID=A0A2I1H0N2_9GLOM|nr:hypothetical protein RhiirA4_425276 [Rhizophagus irregularis]